MYTHPAFTSQAGGMDVRVEVDLGRFLRRRKLLTADIATRASLGSREQLRRVLRTSGTFGLGQGNADWRKVVVGSFLFRP